MAAIITEKILEQNFEAVLTRIGEILLLELTNQKVSQPLRLPEKFSVFKERITSIDKTEEVMINVLLDGFANRHATQSDQQNNTNFFIDIYANGKAKPNEKGDNIVATKLQKYIGLCRYILQSHKYVTLGFTPGSIGGKSVETFQMYEQPNTPDANFARMGRIGFSVRIMENQELWDGIALDNNITTVLLEETDKGYQYKLNAT